MIQPLNVSNDLEQAVQISANHNLDLGRAAVEKAVIEKALQTIGEIDGQLVVKRKCRDAVGPAYLTQLPEALHPIPGRLSPSPPATSL
ncbi:hypothetical protein C5167_025395 [Papaver somniferum]|uniref:CCR4-NOT transcription complex subunit 1 domain-containing protein n=1 Tax=Papaver somniferum TaxID=3469 RepID=A0A4Y7JSW0_PAPSO|nr:hypothetical protein C5167_025395 [Papaver somniferum]